MFNKSLLYLLKSFTLKFLNLNNYLIAKCASVYLVDAVGGTAALIVGWGVQCSAYVQVCGCLKGIS
jgi:hypothetical protein